MLRNWFIARPSSRLPSSNRSRTTRSSSACMRVFTWAAVTSPPPGGDSATALLNHSATAALWAHPGHGLLAVVFAFLLLALLQFVVKNLFDLAGDGRRLGGRDGLFVG